MTEVVAEAWDIGTGVRGYRWRAQNAHASLLLQHGYAEYAGRYVERYSRLIPHLIGAGFDVHAFDMRGHGASPGARGATDVERAVQDHLAARRMLEGSKPIFLFGHSLGGLVTAASVARDQRKVAGVVLTSPALLLTAPPALRLIARGLAWVTPTIGVVQPQAATGISRDPREVRLFEHDPKIYRGKMPARLGASALRVANGSWPRYPYWTVPTLTLHGTDDTYTDPKGSALFHALIRPSVKEFVSIKSGRHEILNDLDRLALLNVVLSWLGSLTNFRIA
jgi:alpha-beta hydrolase superfamily lysophospholipase